MPASRPTWREQFRLIAITVCVLALMGALFAYSADNGEQAAPQYALAESEIPRLPGGAIIQNTGGLVIMAVSRGEEQFGDALLVGMLVWMPTLTAAIAFAFFLHFQSLSTSWWYLLAFLLAIAVSTVTWNWRLSVAGLLLFLIVVAAWPRKHLQRDAAATSGTIPVTKSAVDDKTGFRWHRLIVVILLTSALFMSTTTHAIFDANNGFAILPHEDWSTLERQIDELSLQTPPSGASALASQMALVPRRNAFTPTFDHFAINLVSSIVYLLTSIVYLLYWTVRLGPELCAGPDSRTARLALFARRLRRKRPSRPASPPSSAPSSLLARNAAGALVMVTFAIAFYISVGVGFGIRYYNSYVTAVAQQNAMLRFAGHTIDVYGLLHPDVDEEIDPSQEPPQECVPLLRRAAKRGDLRPELADALVSACGRHWPSSVISQERPRSGSVQPDGDPTPNLAFDPFISFDDLLYFSFVSFTTTGYGDIKPVSDEIRRWVIIENISEILFTAMFFVTAMEVAKQ
jgi:hypothetical protein